MTGWILFLSLFSFMFGIVVGWFFCIWSLANYAARNILKKEEKDGGL